MWMLTTVHCASLVLAAILLVLAAIQDAHHYRMPNVLCAALTALFPVFVLTAPHALEWDQNLMIFGLVLLAGLAMFYAKLVGAADVKLLAATGLWAGPHFVALFLIAAAVTGGILGLVMMILTLARNRKRQEGLPMAKVPIPYGVAIAAGGLVVIYKLFMPLFFSG